MERTRCFAPAFEGGGLTVLQSIAHSPIRPFAGSPRRTGGTANAFHSLQRAVGNGVVQRAVRSAFNDAPSASETENASVVLVGREILFRQPISSCGGSCAKCKGQEKSPIALQKKSSGKPLASSVRADMEGRFGEDFSRVRVHTDGRARQSARQLNADAYTVGRDIFFDAGKYDPNSYRGRRLLAHELTHVVQQDRGLRARQSSVTMGQPGDRYEREAERVSERVARPGAAVSANGPVQRGNGRGVVEVRERWRGPDALLSRATPAEAPGKGPSPMQKAGLNATQVACIKRIFEKAMSMPKSDKWKRCYVTAQVASCNLPAVQNIEAVKAALNEAVAPATWELYLADPKGLTCRTQSGQTPEVCCEEAPPPKEKPKEAAAAPKK